MRNYIPLKIVLVILLSQIIFSPNAFAIQKVLFDNFDQGYLDRKRWIETEGYRHIFNGKLVLSVRSVNVAPTERTWRLVPNPAFGFPSGVKAHVAIEDIQSNGADQRVFSGIAGKYYNTEHQTNASIGEVYAAVYVGNRGEGLEAWWEVERYFEDISDYGIESGSLMSPGTLQTQTEYELTLQWDGISGFLFAVDTTQVNIQGPAFFGVVGTPGRELRSASEILSEEGSVAGMTATFDNVYASDDTDPSLYTLIDDFTANEIDLEKWVRPEARRLVENGSLQLEAFGDGQNRQTRNVTPLDSHSKYLGATMRLNSTTSVIPGNGARARVTISGNFYNEEIDSASGEIFDGQTGDIVGFMGIEERTNSAGTGTIKRLFAGASARRNADGSQRETIFFEPFSATVDYDTNFDVSMEFDGSKIIYRADGAIKEFVPVIGNGQGIYPVEKAFRSVFARIEKGAGGFVSGTVDDVYTSPEITLDPNAWKIVSLPADPGSMNSVAEIFGDDLPVADYGDKWLVFGFNPESGVYINLGTSGLMENGTGYWVLHSYDMPILLDMPEGSTPVASTETVGCSSPADCFGKSVATNGEVLWGLVGNPANGFISFNSLRATTSAGVCSSGCTLSEAQSEDLLHNQIWTFPSEEGGFQVIESGDVLSPWVGGWLPSLPGADGLSPKLLFPL